MTYLWTLFFQAKRYGLQLFLGSTRRVCGTANPPIGRRVAAVTTARTGLHRFSGGNNCQYAVWDSQSLPSRNHRGRWTALVANSVILVLISGLSDLNGCSQWMLAGCIHLLELSMLYANWFVYYLPLDVFMHADVMFNFTISNDLQLLDFAFPD